MKKFIKILAMLILTVAPCLNAQVQLGRNVKVGTQGTGTSGVQSINGVLGAFTFTGSGVSCSSTTCTFTGAALPVTTKGDLLGYSTLAARIPIGADGQVLTADSTQALGLKWAATGAGSGVQYNPATTRNAGISDSRWINSTDVNVGTNQFTPSSYTCNGTTCTVTGTGGSGWVVNDYGIIWWPVTPSCMQGSWVQVTATSSTTLAFPESQTQSCSGSISGSASGSIVWANNTVIARVQAKPFFNGHGTSSLLLKAASGDGTVAEWDALVATTITNWYTACSIAGGPCNLFVSLGFDDLFATPCSSYGTLTGSYTTAGSFRKFYNDVHAVGNINIITVTEPSRFSGGFCSNTAQDMIAVNQYLTTLSGPGAATTGQKDYADHIIDGATPLGQMGNANYFDTLHYSNQGADVLADAINNGMASQGSFNLGQPLNNGPNVMYGEQIFTLPSGTNNAPIQGYGHNGSYTQDFFLQNVVGTPEWWVAGNFAYTFKWNSGTSAMWNATGSNGCWGWTSSTGGGAPDTCIWRVSANVLSIGDANKASSNSSFKLTGIFGQSTAPSGTCAAGIAGMWQFTTDGAITRCPSGGGTWTTFAAGTGLSGMTTGQVPIAATASTVTSSEPLAGAGAGITTGPTSATTAGHIATFVGTNGQIQDGGALSGTAPIVVSGFAISCPTCGTGSGGTSVSQNSGAAETNLPITGYMPQACLDSSGSGTAQVCTVANTFVPQANNCIVYKTTTANSGTGLTVNVNSLGAKSVAVAGSSGWTTTLVASSSIPVNKPMNLCYDGTNWNASGTGFIPASGSGAITNVTSSLTPTNCTISGNICATTGAVASITLASIPAGHNNLRIVFYGGGSAATSQWIQVQLNGDTGANYDYVASTANDGAAAPVRVSNHNNATAYACDLSATTFSGGGEMQITGYAGTTFFKSIRGVCGADGPSINFNEVGDWNLTWKGTPAAITSIKFIPQSGNFVTGTTFIVYAED